MVCNFIVNGMIWYIGYEYVVEPFIMETSLIFVLAIFKFLFV